MATDTNNFKKFLEKSYDSTFNTRRSGKDNTLTNVNFCIVYVLNKILETPIKEFELQMTSGCYTEILDTGSGDIIARCLEGYGEITRDTTNQILSCINPTTTTTTSRKF